MTPFSAQSHTVAAEICDTLHFAPKSTILVAMKQLYHLPCINMQGDVIMSLIHRPVILSGSRGKREVSALFDSGASYSCISRDVAESLEQLTPLSDPMEFETAEKNGIIIARHRVVLDFFFEDTPRRFTDELIVFDTLSEPLIIGAKTMQAWKIRLDFETEEVLYDKRMHRLRI